MSKLFSGSPGTMAARCAPLAAAFPDSEGKAMLSRPPPRQISVAEGRFRELEGCYWLVGNYYSSVAAQARMRLRNGASLLLRCKGVEALMAWRSSAARACGRRSSVPHTMRT